MGYKWPGGTHGAFLFFAFESKTLFNRQESEELQSSSLSWLVHPETPLAVWGHCPLGSRSLPGTWTAAPPWRGDHPSPLQCWRRRKGTGLLFFHCSVPLVILRLHIQPERGWTFRHRRIGTILKDTTMLKEKVNALILLTLPCNRKGTLGIFRKKKKRFPQGMPKFLTVRFFLWESQLFFQEPPSHNPLSRLYSSPTEIQPPA